MNETVERILTLKREKEAILLAHHYMPEEVQAVADYVGDSLGLSRQAAAAPGKRIVFCGVYFMAETAKILSPQKKVLLPDSEAGCPMADMITPEELKAFQQAHPGSVTVCYVNSSAAVKAASDICCTSSNAITVVESIPKDKRILFVPDRFLGDFVKSRTGRDIVTWSGYCPTHARITAEVVQQAKARHPGAVVLVHPECRPEVIVLAHAALSTGQMIEYAQKSLAREFLIGTEKGILTQLRKRCPDKEFHLLAKDILCPNMKKITLDKILHSLEQDVGEVTVDPQIAARAKQAIDAMLAL
ncbi:MAG: quinolinate synthase NadA [Fibrobacterota bacterium]